MLIKLFLFLTLVWAAQENHPAPNLEAKTLSGASFSTDKARGQVIIIHFGALWCEACEQEMPLLASYFEKHRQEGLQILVVSMDSKEDQKKVRQEMKKYSFQTALRGDTQFKEYGRIWRLPLTFVIDRQGVLRKDGWVQDHTLTQADLDAVVTPLLKAK